MRILILYLIVIGFSVACLTIGKFTDFNFFYTMLPKPCFPFEEPSQFALWAAPFLIFIMGYLNQERRRLVVLLLAFLSAYSANTTFGLFALVAFVLIVDYENTIRWSLVFILSVVAYAVVDIMLNNFYISERIMELRLGSIRNMSTLVYLQGWENVKNTIEIYPQGLGFQNLGTEPPNDISYKIRSIAFADVNRKDGGFLFSKLFSEFGFSLVPILLACIYWFTRQYKVAITICEKKAKSVLFLYLSLLVPLFARDAAYFSYSTFYIFFGAGYLNGIVNMKSEIAHSQQFDYVLNQ